MDFSTITHISYNNAGIDTDTIVQKLMQAEQVPLNQLKQKQQKDLWLSDAYRQWNTDIFSFNNDTVFNMKMSSNYDIYNVSTPSQDNSVTGTATANAIAGTYTLGVIGLAKAAKLTGNKTFSPSDDLLKTGTAGTNLDGSLDINISINDPKNPNVSQTGIVHIPADAKIADVVSAFNNAKDSTGKTIGIQTFYDSNLQQFSLQTNSTGAATKIDLSGNTGFASTFLTNNLGLSNSANVMTGNAVSNLTNVNSAITIQLDSGSQSPISSTLNISGTFDSAQAYIDQINKQISSDINLKGQVTACLDQNNNLQFISTGHTLTVSGTAPGIPTNGSNSSLKQPIAVGSNADIKFNGTEITTLANNTVTLLGVNYTLNSVNTQTDPNGTTITVSRNIDTEVKNIENFVSKYNDILGKLNTALTEPVYSNYQPLTDDQRSQMTDTQIQQWETKAKSGLMHNGSILSGLVIKMRSAMTSFVDNGSSYNSLASIGITSHSYSDQGKLYVDEDKLRAALQDDPNGVKNLFSQLGDGVGNQLGKQGIVQSLSDCLTDAFTQLVQKAGSTSGSQYDQSFLGQALTSLNTQISDMTSKLQAKENSYYKQYDAMQQAVANFQSQSSWLTQQMGGTNTTSG